MKLSVKNDRPVIRPVKQIELSGEKLRLRTVLLVLALAAALVSFGFGINALLSADPGWQEIPVLKTNEISSGSEFTFYYNVGAGETSATKEYKALRSLYTQAAVDSCRLFSADEDFDGCKNLWYLNHHVNEAVEVEPALYDALVLLEEIGTRYHYLGPVAELYVSLFHCESDGETADYDPYLNDSLRAFYAETAAFVNDPEAIRLELLGNNTVRLHISDGYLRFAEENGIGRFIDCFWLKNAFIADYIAGILLENGYTLGTLISQDGFIRNLDDVTGTEYAVSFSHRDGTVISDLATLRFSGRVSIVYLHDYPLRGENSGNYYVRDDGLIRTAFVDPADGLCKSAIPELAAYSTVLSCAEIALKAAPIYIASEFDEDALHTLMQTDIFSYYYTGHGLQHTGAE